MKYEVDTLLSLVLGAFMMLIFMLAIFGDGFRGKIIAYDRAIQQCEKQLTLRKEYCEITAIVMVKE